ncbi:MAG TPA: NUDIX hydrolase [Steroidobacteraceae bacterium]
MSGTDITNVFSGRVIDVNIERVALPNGTTATLEIIRHPGGAAVLALDASDRVCLLRQFRHAAGGWVWELPAGKIDNREPPLDTARRELEEEAGMAADSWQSLGDYLSSPGVFTEVVHLFLATQLTPLPPRPEEHEVFEVHWLPYGDVLAMAQSGELRDGKSLVAVFRAATRVPRAD